MQGQRIDTLAEGLPRTTTPPLVKRDFFSNLCVYILARASDYRGDELAENVPLGEGFFCHAFAERKSIILLVFLLGDV